MGIAFHELNFLRMFPPRGETLTLGRQNYGRGYAEKLLIGLGAKSVESIDFSNFEGATYTADLNVPIDLGRQFDTVIDFGTTEHVFNAAQALHNCVHLCRVGGTILHSLPSNGDCGHGFWQISPELFFSLYSERNGFAETEIFIADLMDERHWWKAHRPKPGRRLMANGLTTTYVLARTVKAAERSLQVSQSDYEHVWESRTPQNERGRDARAGWLRNLLKHSPFSHLGSIAYRRLIAPTGLTRFNPDLEKISVPRSDAFDSGGS